MKVVVSLNPIPPIADTRAFDDTDIYTQGELQVPAYAVEDYKNAFVCSRFKNIIPLDIDEILPESIIITGIPDGPIRPSENLQLLAQIFPEDAFSKSVVWSSSKTWIFK